MNVTTGAEREDWGAMALIAAEGPLLGSVSYVRYLDGARLLKRAQGVCELTCLTTRHGASVLRHRRGHRQAVVRV